jgi:polysaccharide export outer membrane protein
MKYPKLSSLNHLPRLLPACLLGLLLSSSLLAQSRRPNSSPLPQSERPATGVSANTGEGVLADTNKDYQIAAGDVVEVWIEDAPELSRNYRVNAAGEFPMEVVGRVKAKQKTTEELAAFIASRLRAEEFLNKPNVVVTIRQYNSQTFIVQGAVNRPGVFQLEGRPSLLTLIGLASGLTENHGSIAYILRSKQPGGGQNQPTPAAANTSTEATQAEDETADDYELIKVNLGSLYKGHFEQNQLLEPGDIVNIPRADVFFVAGEVNAPGSYPLKEGTTLRQAISLAQGMTFKAKAGNGVIFREDPETGKRQELKIDIGSVMSGKKEDLLIMANDVVIIPNSRTKSISSALLTALGTSSARIPMRY